MLRRILTQVTFFFIFIVTAQTTELDSLISLTDDLVHKLDYKKEWTNIKEFQIENFTEKEAYLKLYYGDNQLQKVVLEGGNTGSEIKKSYYLKDGELFYVVEESMEYNTDPIGEQYDPVIDEFVLYKTKNYFKHDKLVRQLDNMDGGHPFSKEYLKAAGESILDDFRILLSAASTKD